MNSLKQIIKMSLTDTDIHIKNKNIQIYAKTCFWSKKNFSAIIKYYGKKYYCFYDNAINDIIIESC